MPTAIRGTVSTTIDTCCVPFKYYLMAAKIKSRDRTARAKDTCLAGLEKALYPFYLDGCVKSYRESRKPAKDTHARPKPSVVLNTPFYVPSDDKWYVNLHENAAPHEVVSEALGSDGATSWKYVAVARTPQASVANEKLVTRAPMMLQAVTLGTSLAAASASEQTNYQVVQEGHGGGTCGHDLTIQQYELALEKISRLEYKFQKTETEFALLASGYTAQWLAASAAGLEEHKQYLVVEAAKPELVEAVWEFKQAWNAFRDSCPGDALDFATGPEEYHAVHARFHPQYRAILYERNYYDIFFLDTAGNCIYSVYKEPSSCSDDAADTGCRLRAASCLFTYNSAELSEDWWEPFVAWLQTLEFVVRWTATLETSLRSGLEGRLHLHVFMEFNKAVD
eukprot:s5009_g1.t1